MVREGFRGFCEGLVRQAIIITPIPIGYSFNPTYRTVTLFLLSRTGFDVTDTAGNSQTRFYTDR